MTLWFLPFNLLGLSESIGEKLEKSGDLSKLVENFLRSKSKSKKDAKNFL